MSSSPMFHLRLFGVPSIERDGPDPVRLTGLVTQHHLVALLALLAMAPRQRLSRDRLMAYLWPDSDTERGRNHLEASIDALRTELGDGALVSDGDELQLGADVVDADAVEFEAALAKPDHAAAVDLYRGPFLDGFLLSDAPELEQWVSAERTRLAAAHAKALEALAEEAEARRHFATAVELWRTRATQDQYDSRVALGLVRSLEACGNRLGALKHASAHERLLQKDLGIAPAPEIKALADRLHREPRHETPAVARAAAAQAMASDDGRNRAERSRGRRLGWVAAIATVLAIAMASGALWRSRRTVSPQDGRIAVLPFVNLTAVRDNDFVSEGLTDEITTGLSALPELRVTSRASAMHYKGSDRPRLQIAEELGVAHVLEGSVRQNGARLRITAQLIDADADENRWSESYDTDASDMPRVEAQIARDVVRALGLKLGTRESTALVRRGTSVPEAYELYRRGRYLSNTRTRTGHDGAIQYFQRAVARDSTFADAYAAMAVAYMTANQLNVSSLTEEELYSRTKVAAERALALDDRSADAHASFAAVLQRQRDWPGAEREFKRAIELNPSHASARTWYSLLLAGFGERTLFHALEESRRAYELDPFAVVMGSNYGWQCYLTRDYDCAIAQYRRAIESDSAYGRVYERLALALAQKGQHVEAIGALEKAIELDPERPDYVADLAYVQALRGDTAIAVATIERAKRRPFEPFNIGRAYVALGEPDSAFAWLERSSWQWPDRAARIDPGLVPLHGDPRFARLSARVNRDMGMR